ncbi:LysM peptidoglycan-binding domain-containing protein [Arthrobacter sp. CG_A4]|uniref:LysM peptidoglycan-binding domain-containing protein n=1 Tax=Arthrobacter sp. CG_A4 TaxID=3071706 RepID=UPI002DFAD827|nr:nucleoid-associated protein YgaU [Arthrobacter sp. CG_A4]
MVTAAAASSGTRQPLRADAFMAAAILLLGLFLAGTGNTLVQRWRSSAARQQSLGFEDQLGIVANTAGLIVITWWIMSLAAAVSAALLQRGGRTRAASAAGGFAPAFMRRLALAAVGLQLLGAPLATAAAPAVPDAGSAQPAVSAAWTPTPVPAPSTAVPAPSAESGPAPAPDPAPTAGVDPQWTPHSPVVDPGPLAGQQLRGQEPTERRTHVTVLAGDSLWSLSAARLGPFASDVDIAMDWPRLYRANRDVIGGNPHILRPGQVLRLPPGD